MLREPVDRALSSYHFFRQHGVEALRRMGAGRAAERAAELPLAEFLRAEPDAARHHLGNLQTAMFSFPPMEQAYPDVSPDAADLEAARCNLAECAVVGAAPIGCVL